MHLRYFYLFIFITLFSSVFSFGFSEKTPFLNNQKKVSSNSSNTSLSHLPSSNIITAKKDKNTGFCLYFTGLSASGKSTLVQALKEKMLKQDPNQVITILDGDEIRENISPELGFSKKDRSLNVRRIGYIASLIAKHGGICLCANIAPYDEDRQLNREKISQNGQYIEIYVDTPIKVCEQRDPKGLYKLARAGKIKEFTGISDPYETPNNSEIHLNGAKNIDSNLEEILTYLQSRKLYP